MKILVVNKFLYPRGGDCVYTLNLARVLRDKGHEVRFYAMDYPQNLPDEDCVFFADEVSFGSKTFGGRYKAMMRLLKGSGVRKGYERLLDDFRPDVVHLNNIHSYLSPLVAKIAHERGIKVLWTMHDYKLICPSYSCLCKGEVCEACLEKPTQVLAQRCFKNSSFASLLAWVESVCWSRHKLAEWTDRFICPSHFLAGKMRVGGFPDNKLTVMHNFIAGNHYQHIQREVSVEREKAYAYIGRLSEEKGVKGLLEVASRLPYKLYVAGTGPLEESLKEQYASENICFLGHLSEEETIRLMKKVYFSVVPSIWYENNPFSIIESLCCGTPVLGRRMGGIPELIEEVEGCRMFETDVELPEAIRCMFDKPVDRDKLTRDSLERFSSERYYEEWAKCLS